MITADPADLGLRIDVRGKPMAQPRSKSVNRGPRAGIYTPATADGWKTLVALAVRELPRREGGQVLWLKFDFERPKGHYGAKGLRASAPELHEQKPDTDNLGKSVLDAMVDAGFLPDDRLVVGLFITKEWSTAGGCQITIRNAKRSNS
jgi:Holliday junction resolvase RusA-like endonuclease